MCLVSSVYICFKRGSCRMQNLCWCSQKSKSKFKFKVERWVLSHKTRETRHKVGLAGKWGHDSKLDYDTREQEKEEKYRESSELWLSGKEKKRVNAFQFAQYLRNSCFFIALFIWIQPHTHHTHTLGSSLSVCVCVYVLCLSWEERSFFSSSLWHFMYMYTKWYVLIPSFLPLVNEMRSEWNI